MTLSAFHQGDRSKSFNRQGEKDWVSSYQCLHCRHKRRSIL